MGPKIILSVPNDIPQRIGWTRCFCNVQEAKRLSQRQSTFLVTFAFVLCLIGLFFILKALVDAQIGSQRTSANTNHYDYLNASLDNNTIGIIKEKNQSVLDISGFVKMTSVMKTTPGYGSQTAVPPIDADSCATRCLDYNLAQYPSCNGFQFLGTCTLLELAEESLLPYDHTLPTQTVYILENMTKEIFNYRLVSITPDLRISVYGKYDQLISGFSFWTTGNVGSWLQSANNSSTLYNFSSQIFVLCGGFFRISKSILSQNTNANYMDLCVYQILNDSVGKIPPWNGFIKMFFQRIFPSLVSVQKKIFIIGGANSSVQDNVIEVLTAGQLSTTVIGVNSTRDILLTSLNFSCLIGVESQNLFIVTGGFSDFGVVSSVGAFEVATSDWISLPSMSQARFHHGCSLLEDQINTFVFVFGGNSGSEDLSSIERLNLLDSNYQWTSMVQSLPQTIGWILGTVVQKFDDNYCALIILDYITKRVFSCDGNFEWTSRDVAWTFGDKINSFTKFDASFFGPTQL